MKTVWKFPIVIEDTFELELPEDAEILHVDSQEQRYAYLWALVDPDVPKERRRFRLAGTGHPIDDSLEITGLEHVGSFQLHGGRLVYHLFEMLP
jgi:hypothetical protein